MIKCPSPVILCILDGWGHCADSAHNAILSAHLPTWERLLKDYPYTLLEASALNVGLPEGQMGNSEVGHMTIGTGRIIYQDLPRIDQAIERQSFKEIPAFREFSEKLKQAQSICHMLGLLSPGGVHSHQSHIAAFAKALAAEGIPVKVHAFLDGRDMPPRSGQECVKSFLSDIQTFSSSIQIASIAGRYYGMDRDNRWERTEKSYRAIAYGDAPRFDDPLAYIEQCYAQDMTDEFIIPAVAGDYQGIQEKDGLLHMNFRADRVRQLLSAFTLPLFQGFERGEPLEFSAIAGMTKYSDDLASHCSIFFPPLTIDESLGEIISLQGFKQLRAAETEKYAHVTFFFNGGLETPFLGEERLLIPSPLVATYDLKPEMSAFELTERLIEAHLKNHYDFIVVNYANADMVGHSGNFEASLKAVETIDQCLSRLCQLTDETDGILAITSDHGNIEQIYDPKTGQAHTAHTLNPVPFLIYGNKARNLSLQPGQLSDVAPTLLSAYAACSACCYDR